MDAGDDQLGRARVKLTNVWATMKGVFISQSIETSIITELGRLTITIT